MAKVLVAGYGSAGQYVVDFLLKDPRLSPDELESIHIMSRKSLEEVNPRLEISRVAAGISNRFIPLEYHCVNFDDHDILVSTLKEISPDVIVYTGRFAAGLKYGAFSYPKKIGYGVWMPLSLVYIYKLMKAVKESGIVTKVINTSFPDGVNHFLGKQGLAPYCGAGNLNHLVPRMRRALAKTLEVSAAEVDIDLACAHYTNTYLSKEGTSKGSEFLLSWQYKEGMRGFITSHDENILKEFMDNSAGGQVRNLMIATDCAEIVRGLISDKSQGEVIHVPGVAGRPGGSRYRFESKELVPYTDFADDEIDRVNLKGLRCDGVFFDPRYPDCIGFTQEVRDKMKKHYSLKYPEFLNISDCEEFAETVRDTLYERSAD